MPVDAAAPENEGPLRARASSEATPRLIGLVTDDVAAYVRSRNAECVDFEARRGARVSPRQWLSTAAAIAGRSARDAASLADALLARAGLGIGAPVTIGALAPHQHAALAIAEVAVVIADDPTSAVVVVPQPPMPWPQRNDVRRLAAALLSGAEVVLHAFVAWELLPLVEPDFIVDRSGGSIAPPEGTRTLLVRVFGVGAPYDAFRAALEAKGIMIAGGPIAHVLAAPKGIGPTEVLAAAFEAGLDVLEVREAFEK